MTGLVPQPQPSADHAMAALVHARRTMVFDQIQARGVSHPQAIAAMLQVPREMFVPSHLVQYAYDDRPLPIGFGQTISQPFTVAFQCAALLLTGHEKVLEVGTGCGYAVAVLSLLTEYVHSIERVAELAAQAEDRLAKLGYRNVQVHTGDGSLGLPAHAPFDAIVCTAGAPNLPAALVGQLADGGRLVIPIGPTHHNQVMMRYTRRGGELREEDLGPFAFVPLVGKQGWREPGADGDEASVY